VRLWGGSFAAAQRRLTQLLLMPPRLAAGRPLRCRPACLSGRRPAGVAARL